MGVKPRNNSNVTNRELVYCTGCDKEKKPTEFYKSYGATKSGLLPFCKKCCKEYSLNENKEFDVNKFKEMLQKIDRPFLYDILSNNLERNKKVEGAIGKYFKDIGMVQYRELKYKDSIFQSKSEEKKNEMLEDERIIPKELIEKWGKAYTYDQIQKLEHFHKDMSTSYDVKTASHKDYLKKICKVSLKMDEALDSDNISEFEKLSKQYDTLMKSAKFTAVQRSAVDDAGGFATISEFTDALEKRGFIMPTKIEEDYDIVEQTIADMKKYTKQLVLGDSSISALAQKTLMKQNKDEYEEENNE